ncbi:MAG: hypothetical protein Q4A66_11975, partial [Eubacteriales bacterium]|nr:hypothetical protein [Eubacteriales bacterium]
VKKDEDRKMKQSRVISFFGKTEHNMQQSAVCRPGRRCFLFTSRPGGVFFNVLRGRRPCFLCAVRTGKERKDAVQ